MSNKKDSSSKGSWKKSFTTEIKGFADALTGNSNKYRDSEDYDVQIRRKK